MKNKLIVIACVALTLIGIFLYKDRNAYLELAKENKKRSDILVEESNELRKRSIALEKDIHDKTSRINYLKGLLQKHPPNDDGGIPDSRLDNSNTLSSLIKNSLPKNIKYEGQLVIALELADTIEQESLLKTKQIDTLMAENQKLRDSITYKDRAYELQLDIIKANNEAMNKAKLMYGSGGVALGFIVSLITK